MFWDPEVESPASIAIIGAGPVGIEAALYARFLGYNVDIYDIGRPARRATQWNDRSIEVTTEQCTTSLGHAALAAQDEAYRTPASSRIFTGREFSEEYLTPIAKSDLLYDFVHFNCEIVDIGRYRSHRDDFRDLFSQPIQFAYGFVKSAESATVRDRLQERANGEFRLVVRSRDKGLYTARADLIIDCRGFEKGEAGWGPGGGLSMGAAIVQASIHTSLPEDAKFEWHAFEGKKAILFGRSERATRFAEEWSRTVQSQTKDVRLLWIIPLAGDDRDESIVGNALRIEKVVGDPSRFSLLMTLGIERIVRTESGEWRLKILQADDSTVDVTGDFFAPFTEARPTPELGSEMLPQQRMELNYCVEQDFSPRPVFGERGGGEGPDSLRDSRLENDKPDRISDSKLAPYYSDFPGWRVATYEPHYYRLGSTLKPHHTSGLSEAFLEIRDLFALLGARKDLDLYRHFAEQRKST
jgi:hypothetical protein